MECPVPSSLPQPPTPMNCRTRRRTTRLSSVQLSSYLHEDIELFRMIAYFSCMYLLQILINSGKRTVSPQTIANH